MMRSVSWIILLAVVLLLAGLPSMVRGQSLTNSVLKAVDFLYVGTNVGTGTYSNLRVYIGIPQSLPGQMLQSIEWTPEPTSVAIDAYGQPVAEFYFGTVVPGQSVSIRMVAVGLFSRVEWSIPQESVGALTDIPPEIASLYTADGSYYHTTDPLIMDTSASVLDGETNPYAMAVLLHDYVAETLTYDNDSSWDDAVTVLRRGTGSCSEYTFVFIALARAAGLPARFAGGSRCRELVGQSVDDSGHRWAEAYLPNYGWIPFDAQADTVPEGTQATHYGVAAHAHALITVRGGGDDLDYLGMNYISRVRWTGTSDWDSDWEVTWTDASFPDTGASFRVDAFGNVFSDGALYGSQFQSGAADVAEWVPVSELVEPGDVLELDPTSSTTYRLSQSPCSHLIAGVVSTEPGFLLGSDGTNSETGSASPGSGLWTMDHGLGASTSDSAPLALTGIVPVKVTNEGGTIQPGDLLVTSSTPGYAMRWAGPDPCPCALVGKALEAMTDEAGTILVLLTAH